MQHVSVIKAGQFEQYLQFPDLVHNYNMTHINFRIYYIKPHSFELSTTYRYNKLQNTEHKIGVLNRKTV